MMSRSRIRRIWALAAGLCGIAFMIAWADGALHDMAAQSPFGAPKSASGNGGIVGWILAKQAEFYRAMSMALKQAKTDGSAVATLMGVSFLYGIFHAAGPGHGKAVISSYMIANAETARRGIVLSFASALLQALVAIAIVSVGALLLGATGRAMCDAERVIEIASYGLIAALGLRLMWVKGRSLLAAWRSPQHDHAHDRNGGDAHGHHGHDHHAHGHHAHHHHDGACGHDHSSAHTHGTHHGHHVHDDHCGHSHGPTPQELAGPGGWRRGLAAVVSVGVRPCSGAILVLIFSLAQGLFWAGVASTLLMGLGTAMTVTAIALLAVWARAWAIRFSAMSGAAGGGARVLRLIELAAAIVVFVFGVALLAGYLVAERSACL